MQVISKQTRTGQQLEITVEDNADGNPVAVIYLDGKRITDGGVTDSRRAVRPVKMPVGCTHIVANKVALPADEGERLEAALKQARAAKEQRLATIFPGLSELEAAYTAWVNYKGDYEKWVDNGDGTNPPAEPKCNLVSLRTQYPAATLYLKAKSYETDSNVNKRIAGEKARKLLEAGGELEEARNILKNWLPEEAMWD
jgi:hypothetical protein